jgi:hypothetical protein
MNAKTMIQRILQGFLFVAALNGNLHAQFLSTTIATGDWGIKDISRIAVVQVSVMQERRGKTLQVYVLRDTLPPAVTREPVGKTPAFSGSSYIISEFQYSQINALGGIFSGYQKEPSWAKAELADAKDGRRVLRLSMKKKSDGYCGLWIHLFNSAAPPQHRIYLDAKPFEALTFWIRGNQGGERMTVKLADADWVLKEDALPIGDAGQFIASGRIDTNWQQVVIPLSRVPGRIDITRLGSLVLEADSLIDGLVEIASLALSKDQKSPFPIPAAVRAAAFDNVPRALWYWNTPSLLSSQIEEENFVRFLKDHDLSTVYLALPYDSEHARRTGSIRIDQKKLQPLIRHMHQLGIRVHALLGDKNFALREWHPFVKATIDNIVRYNGSVGPSERFNGIHLDVEPYLLPGFKSPRRTEILAGYLQLLADVSRQAHQAELVIAADIPFWFGMPDDFTQEIGSMAFGGTTKPVNEHVLDMVDEVVVMSYRTNSSGMDGVIYQCLDQITYAQDKGKRVLVGFETGEIPDEHILTFRGKPSTGLGSTTFMGDQLFMVCKADSTTVYLVPDLELKYFAEFVRKQGIGLGKILRWDKGVGQQISGDKLSFANLGPSRMDQTMKETFLALGHYRSFAGFAIHFYDSYKEMLKKITQ